MFFLKWVAFPLANILFGIWGIAQQRRRDALQPESGRKLQLGDFAIGLDLFRNSLMSAILFMLQQLVLLIELSHHELQAIADGDHELLTSLVTRQLGIESVLLRVSPSVCLMLFAFCWLCIDWRSSQEITDWKTFLQWGLPPLLLGATALFAIPYFFFGPSGA